MKNTSEIQLAKERESHISLANEITETKANVNSLQHKLSTLEAESSRKDSTIQRNATELEAQNRALAEKDFVISGMEMQLTKTREYLTTKQQVSKKLLVL